MDKIKVLYVDDEVSNLTAFKASFRRVFDIHLAESAKDGINILNTRPIEVVIADQKMPGITGVDFFESIIKTHPTPIRILLTGYSDIKTVINAINKGKIYQYVTKPWDDYDLKITIENAYHLYHLKEQNSKLTTKYQKVFSECADPIILFDTKNRIFDYNKATLDLFQLQPSSLNLTSFETLIKDKNDQNYIINKIIEKGFVKDYECQIITEKNTVRNCLISANKITNNYGDIISYQAIIKDITEKSKINQILLKTAIQSQEKERERIAKDLHDGLGQSLAAIKIKLEFLKAISDKKDIYSPIDYLLQDSIHQLKEICFNALPTVLIDYGLIKAISNLCSKTSTENFKIHFSHNPSFSKKTQELDVAIYRIIQEFINNTIKHSNASEVFISIQDDNGNINLNLKDNGLGFNITDLTLYDGHGLKNIKTRVESFNGQVNFNSIIAEGTEFDISIPFNLN